MAGQNFTFKTKKRRLKSKIAVSIIIPTKTLNDYLCQKTIPALLSQTYQNFEILILPDRPTTEKFPQTRIIPTWPKVGPADKRDLGAREAKGEILAFLDDDSYPKENWLKRAVATFQQPILGFKPEIVAAVCGPTLTPEDDNLRQKVSGYVWSSWLGSGGAGSYRCTPLSPREVDDYPSVNLLVRKKDFWAVGGFDSHFWPGEDTKLCHDLVYRLKKRIIYHPQIVVYHHRREVFVPHLIQIARYALHRGHFARILPKTSRRLGYFIPSLFVIGLLGGLVLLFVLRVSPFSFLFFPFWLYFFFLLITAIRVCLKERNFLLACLLAPAIFLTHLLYGILFIKGFFSPKLKR